MSAKILLGLAVLWPLASWPADNLKPFDAKLGLWETTVTTQVSGMPAMPAMPQIPESAMSQLPPQQRAQIEAMMKARAGAGAIPATTTKVCVTRASLDAGVFAQSDKSCSPKVLSSSADKQVIHVECTRDKTKSEGDLTIERVDADNAKGTLLMKVSEGGAPMDMKMSFSTKWIAADCGDVKPIGGK